MTKPLRNGYAQNWFDRRLTRGSYEILPVRVQTIVKQSQIVVRNYLIVSIHALLMCATPQLYRGGKVEHEPVDYCSTRGSRSWPGAGDLHRRNWRSRSQRTKHAIPPVRQGSQLRRRWRAACR